jgi:hypothetical protein
MSYGWFVFVERRYVRRTRNTRPITDCAGGRNLIGMTAFLLIGISVFSDRHEALLVIDVGRIAHPPHNEPIRDDEQKRPADDAGRAPLGLSHLSVAPRRWPPVSW